MPHFDPPLSIEELTEALPIELVIIGPLNKGGGQGELFTARYGETEAVLKIYRDAFAVRATRESELLEETDHPNVVRLLAWGEVALREENCIYAITGFIEGQSLRERLAQGPIHYEQVIRACREIGSALDYLWGLERIVHRDINPNNVIMAADGRFVIIDLGIAQHNNLVTITEWGVSWGTYGYKSPEQARGRRNLSYKSDYFALGIVLYEALTGRHPFNRRQELIGRANPPDISSLGDFPQALRNTIMRLLALNPLDRPRDFSHIEQLLEGR